MIFDFNYDLNFKNDTRLRSLVSMRMYDLCQGTLQILTDFGDNHFYLLINYRNKNLHTFKTVCQVVFVHTNDFLKIKHRRASTLSREMENVHFFILPTAKYLYKPLLSVIIILLITILNRLTKRPDNLNRNRSHFLRRS